VLSSFIHVDGLLGHIETLLASRGDVNPLARHADDLSGPQRERTAAGIAQIRAQMVAALERLGIALPSSGASSRWAARTGLMSVLTTLAELEPKRLGGYGALAKEDARALTACLDELEGSVQALIDYLGTGAERRRREGPAP